MPQTSWPTGLPARVGKYDLLAPIASGGMATVFLARQHGLAGFRREVALKLTHAHLREESRWASELVEEAKIAARIQHPNVVQVLDVDDDPLGVFLVMQYIEGDTLAGLLRCVREHAQPMRDAIGLRILDDALAGLHAAHELRDPAGELVGLVHRDFSPQNVLVGVDGIARLTDFGVAKAADRAGFTRTGVIKGKFGYMSPEQVRDRPLDRRSDVWAAGVVAWELLAGRRLYASADQASTLFRIVTEEPPRLRSVRRDISPSIESVVASALTLDVAARCPTAEEFRRQLQAAWVEQEPLAERSEVGAFVWSASANTISGLRRRIDALVDADAEPNGASAGGRADKQSAETQTEVSLVSESVQTVPMAPRYRRHWRVLTVLASVTLAAVVMGLWLPRRASPSRVTVAAAATAASSSAPASSVATEPPSSAEGVAAAVDVPADQPRQVESHANPVVSAPERPVRRQNVLELLRP